MMIRKLLKALLGLAVVVAVVAYTAQAQGTMPDSTVVNVPVWVQHIGEQFAEGLEDPVTEVKLATLQHIAYFAYFYKDALDLEPVLPKLIDIYKEDEDERCRLIALASLHAIGDEGALQQVRQHVEFQTSPRVQLVSMAALMNFYGEGTFAGDQEVAKLAKTLLEYYTSPQIIVGPLILLDVEYPPQ